MKQSDIKLPSNFNEKTLGFELKPHYGARTDSIIETYYDLAKNLQLPLSKEGRVRIVHAFQGQVKQLKDAVKKFEAKQKEKEAKAKAKEDLKQKIKEGKVPKPKTKKEKDKAATKLAALVRGKKARKIAQQLKNKKASEERREREKKAAEERRENAAKKITKALRDYKQKKPKSPNPFIREHTKINIPNRGLLEFIQERIMKTEQKMKNYRKKATVSPGAQGPSEWQKKQGRYANREYKELLKLQKEYNKRTNAYIDYLKKGKAAKKITKAIRDYTQKNFVKEATNSPPPRTQKNKQEKIKNETKKDYDALKKYNQRQTIELARKSSEKSTEKLGTILLDLTRSKKKLNDVRDLCAVLIEGTSIFDGREYPNVNKTVERGNDFVYPIRLAIESADYEMVLILLDCGANLSVNYGLSREAEVKGKIDYLYSPVKVAKEVKKAVPKKAKLSAPEKKYIDESKKNLDYMIELFKHYGYK